MAYENLKSAIKQAIKQNGNQEITGNLLQSTLLNVVNTIGADYKFLGFATPSTVPPTSEEGRLFYFASKAGEYTNFPTTGKNTHIATGDGLYMFTKEANSNYWKADTLIEIVQESGKAEDKVISQKAVSDKLYDLSKHIDASIENSLSNKFNNISIDGNTLTIKKEGFSLFVLGKRIAFSGTEDKVFNSDNNTIRKGVYINMKYIIETSNLSGVNFTENEDVFIEKINSTYNGLLFAEWYLGKLMQTGLVAGFKQLSDTNKQIADTNKQIADRISKTEKNVENINSNVSYNVGAFSSEKDYAKGDTVSYDGKTYIFKAAHTKGEFNADEVQAISNLKLSSINVPTIENGMSGKYNGISIDGDTLTIKKEGFSLFVLGKRIVFSGTEDKVFTGTGIRTSLYLNPYYLINNISVNFTENDDVFIMKQDTVVYKALLFSEWYQGKLMHTGLVAGFKLLSDTNKQIADTNKQLSDTNKQIADTNKIQIYCSDYNIPYIEETKTDKVYVYLRGNICVRVVGYRTIRQSDLLTELGVDGETSPNGVQNCFTISSLQSFVFNISNGKFKIINRDAVTNKDIVLIANIGGSVNISESKNFLAQWYNNRINELEKISLINNGLIYSLNGSNNVTLNVDGSITINKKGVSLFIKGKLYNIVGNTDKTFSPVHPSGKSKSLYYIDTSKLKENNGVNWDEVDGLFKESQYPQDMVLLFGWYYSSKYPQPIGLFASAISMLLPEIQSKNLDTGKELRIRNNVAMNSDFKVIFFSDVHGASENVRRIKEKAASWKSQYVDCILNGGDTVQSFNSEGLDWYNQLVQDSTIPFITAVGNHDAWSTNFWTWDSNESIYNLLTSKVKEYVPSIVQPADVNTTHANYYYYDTEKVRVIVLLSLTFTSSDVYYDEAQDTWLKSVLADAKENNKAVIIMNHGPIDPKDSEEIECNWTSKISWTKDVQDYQHMDNRILENVDSFIDSGGKFICYLAGHSHLDYILRSKNHPRQMCLVITSARYNYGSDCARSQSKDNMDYDSYNYIGVDLTHSVIKVQRIGMNTNAWMQEHNTMCWDFKNSKLISVN